MTNKQIIIFLRNAISESTTYLGDEVQPSMQTQVNGSILAGQIRSLFKILEAEE